MKFKTMSTIFTLALMLVVGFVSLPPVLRTGVASVSASSERNRRLHATKECSTYMGEAGDFCTITSSNLAAITVGSTITYDQALGIPEGLLDSNVVLDAGNGDRAVGRCTLDLATSLGLCTFSDGTGHFRGFNARVEVDCSLGPQCRLDGTYSFDAQRDKDR